MPNCGVLLPLANILPAEQSEPVSLGSRCSEPWKGKLSLETHNMAEKDARNVNSPSPFVQPATFVFVKPLSSLDLTTNTFVTPSFLSVSARRAVPTQQEPGELSE
ncbi:hypothetical protein RRG08_017570 [Elysia crispata]|uniref:Uncharacterized protein n=1 Tax=Elysia crispata TaxID=231223 RepID=A0AAE1E767_9GAST|nr:hypothetical protein RRG08_017570 [Elysia crispata]